jgi:hydrogenase maturation factor
MSGRRLATGKLPAGLLRELLDASAAPAPEVRVGPRIGEDACAIDLAAGTLVVATDPITLTGSEVGAHAVVINANDVAVMGVRPRWFLASVLLPEGSDEGDVRALFRGMRSALDRVGATLVGGHTEVTAAVSQPVVVGQMLGHAEDGAVVASAGVRPGDRIVQVGPAPVEGAALLASEPIASATSKELRARASQGLRDPGISVVDAALLATRLGAQALHDPTEGGLSAALHELAEASGLRLDITAEAVLWFDPGLELCRAVGADPWGLLASGALLAAFREEDSEAALDALRSAGFDAAPIGRATQGEGVWLSRSEPLVRYERDELSRVLAVARAEPRDDSQRS